MKNLAVISGAFLEENKKRLYDYLQTNPGTIQVDIWPYPHLIPAVSSRGEKYVRSTPDPYRHDDLMDLPRE